MKNKKEAFAAFGITQDNEVWSWSGINLDKSAPIDSNLSSPLVVLTIWTDQKYFDKIKKIHIWSTFGKNNKKWINDNGNVKRKEHIRFCIDNLDSEFQAIFIEPINKGVYDETRKIKKMSINTKLWFRITEFDEETGECSAASFNK